MSTVAARPDHEVAIIGAGLGGIGAAIALRRRDFDDIAIFERAADIGGTWHHNTYPGLAVDIPAQAYHFSYELNPEWRGTYARGWEVKAYVDRIADRYDIRRHVRLESEVLERRWDEKSHCWRLRVNGAEVTARFVISAVGAFVNPKPAQVDGLEDFDGEVVHSAAWDHELELAGKRAAIIGTGASAIQIIPKVARELAHLDVYQRTPIWVGPKLDPPTPGPVRWLYRRFPALQRVVYRGTRRLVEAGLIGLVLHHDRYGWITRLGGWLGRNVWYRQVRDREVRRKLTPDYAIGCKRPAVSNDYLRAFNRAAVELVTDPIERITESGIRTADGREREIDLLILATGFRLATDPENYRRNPVRGRNGFDLADYYADNRAASYESVSMPGLPNHFFIFGPYAWTGAAWHELVETASAHMIRVIEEAGRRGATAVEVRPEAAQRWTAGAIERLGRSLWHTTDCVAARSYYFDHHGDTPFLRPTSSRQAWQAARSFPLDDYAFENGSGPAPEAAESGLASAA